MADKIVIGNIIGDYGATRAITTDYDPKKENDVLVQQRDGFGGWRTVGSYNSLSDDYAFTNAREAASKLARRIEGR